MACRCMFEGCQQLQLRPIVPYSDVGPSYVLMGLLLLKKGLENLRRLLVTRTRSSVLKSRARLCSG